MIYNSLNDKYLAVYDLKIINALKRGNFESLSTDVQKQLIGIGALIDNENNEVEHLRSMIEQIDNDTTFFHLIVNPTLDCNLHCWYCYENHVRGASITESLIDCIKALINRHVSNNPTLSFIFLSFFGGEPLLEFDNIVRPLLDWIRKRCKMEGIKLHIQFTSNGVKLNKEIVDFLKEFDCAFQITLDGGKNFHDKVRFEQKASPTYNRIITNIYNLVNAGINVVTRINYTQQNINSISEIINDFKELNFQDSSYLCFDFQKVWQDNPTQSEKNNISELIHKYRCELRKLGFNVANSHMVDYIRYSCYADKTNEVLINYNGDVFACTARDFNKENRKGHLLKNGCIEWENTTYPERYRLKMTKEICKKCRIAPLCGGGCHQKNQEGLSHEFCNVGLNEEDIDDLILKRFEEYFL